MLAAAVIEKEVRQKATKVGASVRNGVLNQAARLTEVMGLSVPVIRFILRS